CGRRSSRRRPPPRPSSPTTARPRFATTRTQLTSPRSSTARARHCRTERPVGDHNHDVYAGHSHRELYDQLMAGKPDQVGGHAAGLRRLNDTLNGLSSTRATDLAELGVTWNSASGQEYSHRLGTIVTYSGTLADDFATLGGHLTTMASDLRNAQKHAE